MINTLINSKKDDTDLISVAQDFVSTLNIKITPTAVEETLVNNPNFPSVAAFTDLLDQFNVDNIALKTSIENLDKMEYPAVVQLNEDKGKFTILSGFKEGKVTYLDSNKKWKNETAVDFEKKWTGTIVMADPSVQSGDPEYTRKLSQEKVTKLRLPFIATGIFLITAIGITFSPSVATSLLFVTALAGALISAGITIIENNQTGALAEKVCKPSKTTDCSKVLSSPAATLFGWLHMSDAGIIYFTGTFLSLFFSVVFGKLAGVTSLLIALNIAALPYTVFSVYYQYKVVRKWCVLCLIAQGLLWAQFMVFGWIFSQSAFQIDLTSLIAVFIGFSIPVFHLLIDGKSVQTYKSKNTRVERQLIAWKRDYDLFHYQLKKQEYVDMETLTQEIIIGNPSAGINITAVINPKCGPCEEVIKELVPLIERKGDEVKLTFRFGAEPMDLMAMHLISLYKSNPSIIAKALQDWYKLNKDYNKWFIMYPAPILPEAADLLKEHRAWCDKVDINATPTIFVDSYKLPDKYWITDLKFVLFN